MRNIRNLKDPPTCVGGGALVVLLLWWCLLWISPVAITATTTTLPKVVCTEHDTKITCDCNNVEQVSLTIIIFLSRSFSFSFFDTLHTPFAGHDHAPIAGQCLSG